ncbi:MAG: hypothetical protein KC560_14370 [Myxococcales bacterium]|nr:hypothetical protein [Myxococcales bacterium]
MDTTPPPPEVRYDRENPWLRYWRAQPGSAVFLIVATIACGAAAPFTGLFPESFGLVRQILAGAFIGFCFAMLPIAHRIWD